MPRISAYVLEPGLPPLLVDCRSSKAFPTSSSSDLFCPSVSGHGPSSRLYLSTLSRLSQGTANPYRVTPMVRPLLLAEPGPGDASCTTWTLTVFIHLVYCQAGRPSSISAFRTLPALRPLPSVSNQSIIFFRFRSRDPLRQHPICRSSPSVSSLSTFSVLPATPIFRLVGFCV